MNGIPTTISIYLSKGGVGKTTLTGLIGQYLAAAGFRVVIVDMDRQGSQAELFRLEPDEILHRVIRREVSVLDALSPVPDDLIPTFDNIQRGELYVVQGGPLSTLAVNEVIENPVDYGIISNLDVISEPLANLGEFDFVLIDLGPSDQRVSLSCLVSSDWLLIPTDCEWLSLQRIEPVLRELALAQRARDVNLIGIVPVNGDYFFGRLRQSKTLAATLDYLETHYGDYLLRDDQGVVDLPHDEDWKAMVWVGSLLFADDTKNKIKTDAHRFLDAVCAKIGVSVYVKQ